MTAKWMDGQGFKTRHDVEIAQVQMEVDAVEVDVANLELSQLTKLGTTAPKINDITISTTEDFKLKAVNVLKFVVGVENQVNTIATFANGESSDFLSDDELIFDGLMKLKTAYSDTMTSDGTLGSGYKFSGVLPKSTFKKIESVSVAGVTSGGSVPLSVAMTSNTVPSPYVTSASSTFSASYPAWASFSPSNANKWTASEAGTQWLKIDLGEGRKIVEYDLATKGVTPDAMVAGIIMTSNTAPSPYVTSASSTFSASYPAWASFSSNNANHWIAANSGYPQWLQIDLGAGRTVIEYNLATKGASDASFVSEWTLRASNTGAFTGEETVVDTRTGRPSSATQVKYVCASHGLFRYYRWLFTAGHSYAGCGEISLFYDAGFVSEWTLRGSNTGAFTGEETVVDTRTGRPTSSTQVKYVCADPDVFRYYQWLFTAGNTYFGCGEIALFQSVVTTKYLFEDGADIKTVVGGALSTVGSTPVTEVMFTGSGISDITLIGNTQIQALSSGTPKMLVYDISSSAKTLDSVRVPLSKLVLPNGDINITSVEGIDSVTITSNVSGSGVVRTIVSVDEGVTWKRWNGSSWVTITPDGSTVLSDGMTPATMNALVRANWDSLTGTGDGMVNAIRFGYLLDITNSTDVSNVDNISATFDMRGSWKKAIHGTDYTYEYPRNNVLRVELLTNGDYKINY